MPRGDGTGPAGMGPMTGRGAGFCAGYGVPGTMNPGVGWGMGPRGGRGMFGRGGGRGRGNWFWATGLTGWQRAAMGWPAYGMPASVPPYPAAPYQTAPYQPTAEQELAALRDQVKFMEDSMKEAQERIRELEKESEQK
jgi:hypothetical protein